MSQFEYNSKPIVQFVVGGVQKAGTTALHQMLEQHPEVCMATKKELHFFDSDSNFISATINLSQYHSEFNHCSTNQLCGEATPAYIYKPTAVQRIFQYNSDMKWIIVLRNPVDRAHSQWNMQRTRGIEDLDFEEALNIETERLASLPEATKQRYAYAERGKYATQIERLFSFFKPEQCLFLKSESLLSKPEITLQQISKFLDISQYSIEYKVSHVGSYNTNLDRNTRLKLINKFTTELKRTEKLTGLDLKTWLTC